MLLFGDYLYLKKDVQLKKGNQCQPIFTGWRLIVAAVLFITFGTVAPSYAQNNSATGGVTAATTVGTVVSGIISAFLLEGCNIPSFTDEQCAEVVQTQAQANQYASVTRIEGSLFISGIGDLDFSPFDSLQEITGQLVIIYGKQSSVIGFNNLQNVGFGINIANNPSLTTVGGFDALTGFSEPSGSLDVADNPRLTQLSGFNGLRSTDRLDILRNPQLQTISRFNALRTVDWTLNILDNPSLSAVRGFNNLRNVGDNTNTAPFGSIGIRDNAGLTVINGFRALETVETGISVRNNPQLSTFAGFDVLQSSRSLLFEDLNVSSIPPFAQLQTIALGLTLNNLPSLTQVPTFQSLTSVSSISLRSLDSIEEISGFNNILAIPFWLNIGSNQNLETISGFSTLQDIGRPGITFIPTFEIRLNNNLNLITGFDNLTAADIIGQVYVERNPRLNCPLYLSAMEPMDFSEGNAINCDVEP